MAEIEYIEIDPVSRKILSPDGMLLGVLEDKDVERKYFKCPKIVGDNIDLSEHQIYIKFVQATDNTGTKFKQKDPGKYHCKDVSDEGDYITFSWKLGQEVFAEEGYVAFAMMAMDGEETRWGTFPAVGKVLITIPGGVEVGNSVDTSGATATADDMAENVTAYANGEKITGTIPVYSSIDRPGTASVYNSNNLAVKTEPLGEKMILGAESYVKAVCEFSEFGDADAEDVAEGKTFTSAAGLKVTGKATASGINTSDATATAEKLLEGETAYANGKKITGTLPFTASGSSRTYWNGTTQPVTKEVATTNDDVKQLVFANEFESDRAFLTGSKIRLRLPISDFGDATAADVVAGKTFTSAEGLNVTGTGKVVYEVLASGTGRYVAVPSDMVGKTLNLYGYESSVDVTTTGSYPDISVTVGKKYNTIFYADKCQTSIDDSEYSESDITVTISSETTTIDGVTAYKLTGLPTGGNSINNLKVIGVINDSAEE